MDEQIETLKKLKELLDAGILTQEEFDKKKSEVMGI
nr:SHOCT domain-containing protein [Weissella confusa]